MENIICPNCGAKMSLSDDKRKMICEYCGTTYSNESAKTASEQLNNRSKYTGELTVYGYNEWYAVAYDVIVFKNGEKIGRIPHGAVFKIDILEDCVIKFKLGIRNCVYHAKRNKKESIQLITNRLTGKFSYRVI